MAETINMGGGTLAAAGRARGEISCQVSQIASHIFIFHLRFGGACVVTDKPAPPFSLCLSISVRCFMLNSLSPCQLVKLGNHRITKLYLQGIYIQMLVDHCHNFVVGHSWS